MGLELGSDDYIAKPFSPRELVLRVNNVIKRVYNGVPDNEIHYNHYRINPDRRTVYVNDVLIDLTSKEMDLMLMLVQNKNRAYTREQILSAIWGEDYFRLRPRGGRSHQAIAQKDAESGYRDHIRIWIQVEAMRRFSLFGQIALIFVLSFTVTNLIIALQVTSTIKKGYQEQLFDMMDAEAKAVRLVPEGETVQPAERMAYIRYTRDGPYTNLLQYT